MTRQIQHPGAVSNARGRRVEQQVADTFHAAGYQPLTGYQISLLRLHIAQGHDPATFFSAHRPQLDWSYVQRMRLVNNLYRLPWTLDAFLWRADAWHGQGLCIEIKSQIATGSVDEKLPFVGLSLKRLNRPTAAVLLGEGFRAAATAWLQEFSNEPDCQVEVFDGMAAFQRYIEDGARAKPKLHVISQQLRLV
jgi:hypothetical protein